MDGAKNIKLICFDLDDTLIEGSSWRTLNAALGVTAEEDSFFYKKYHSNEISYETWVLELTKIFKKEGRANLKNIIDILSPVSYKEGVRNIISYLTDKGYKIALISGSFNSMVDLVARDLGIELAEATNIFIFDKDDSLEKIVHAGKDSIAKLHILEEFCMKLDISLDECACIGDGDNDLEMFRKTNHGITFHDSPIEKDAWRVISSFEDLKKIF